MINVQAEIETIYEEMTNLIDKLHMLSLNNNIQGQWIDSIAKASRSMKDARVSMEDIK